MENLTVFNEKRITTALTPCIVRGYAPFGVPAPNYQVWGMVSFILFRVLSEPPFR